MLSRRCSLVVCALLVAAGAAPALAEDSVTLRYRIAPDERWSTEAVQRSVGSVRINDGTAEPWDATTTLRAEWHCSGMSGDVARLEQNVRELSLVGQTGRDRADLHLDEETIAEAGLAPGRMLLAVSPRGIESVQGAMPQGNALQMMNTALLLSLPTLPEEPLRPGDEWTQAPVVQDRFDKDRRTQYRLVGLEQENGATIARVAFTSSVDVRNPLPEVPPPDATAAHRIRAAPVRFVEQATGEWRFDVDAGRLLETRREGTLSLLWVHFIPTSATDVRALKFDQTLRTTTVVRHGKSLAP